MTLFRTYQPNTRLDHYDLDGLIARLDREVDELGEAGDARTPYYVGAEIAMTIARFHEFVDTQDDFMRLFVRALDEFEGGEQWDNVC